MVTPWSEIVGRFFNVWSATSPRMRSRPRASGCCVPATSEKRKVWGREPTSPFKSELEAECSVSTNAQGRVSASGTKRTNPIAAVMSVNDP